MMLLVRALWLKYRWAWVLGLVGALISLTTYLTHQYKEGQYALREQQSNERYLEELQKRQREYEERVEALNQEALKKQAALSNTNAELERKFHESKQQTDAISRKYDRLVRNGYRLRYKQTPSTPSVQVCGTTQGGTSTTPDSSDGTASGNELPEEVTRNLLRFATDADRVVEQLRIAQEYAKELHRICGS